jgi:putative exporter of polyketide antibiotics
MPSLQVLAQNPAIRVLFGVPLALDNAEGFTVWRTGTFAAVALASWALLMATRITRGEERAGRWGLLLADSACRRSWPTILWCCSVPNSSWVLLWLWPSSWPEQEPAGL